MSHRKVRGVINSPTSNRVLYMNHDYCLYNLIFVCQNKGEVSWSGSYSCCGGSHTAVLLW